MAATNLTEKTEKQQEKDFEKELLSFQELLRENPHDVPPLVKIAKAYYNNDDYANAIEYAQKVLAIDAANVDALNILSYIHYYQDEDEKAIDYCTRWIASDIQNPAIPLAVLNKIYEKKAQREAEKAVQYEKQARQEAERALQYEKQARQEAERASLEEKKRLEEQARNQLDIKQAKLDERNKIIADLSHSIKNLIGTIIDPLENLKREPGIEIRVIENALRGANLIREIVNAMNLSFKGSITDFYYDAEHNAEQDALDLQTILLDSLKYSVGNMFDGKYFASFVQKYFSTKDLYLEAKTQWETISQSHNLERLLPFLQMYFFETEIILDQAERFKIGNEKGSAIKFLILCEELILNAVKYSAFVPQKKRFLRIHFASDVDRIILNVKNRFNPNVKVKTSGIGHIIIENFARLLDVAPKIEKHKSVYTVELAIKNFWEQTTK